MTKQKQRKLHHWPEGWLVRCTPAHTGTTGQSKENTYAILRLDGDRLSFRWIMVLPSRQNSNYISIVHECTSDNVPFKCHILQMTRFSVSYTAGRPGAVWNVRSKNKHYYRKSINTAKNRIESENLILFFKCWFLLIKYLNLYFFIDYHTSALCEQKLKDQKWNLLLFLIFFYVVELKMQISIKYRLKWLNLPK